MNANDWANYAYSLAGLLAFLLVWWKGIRPRWRRFKRALGAVIETLIGREAIVDKATGKELVKAQPGLGVRMENIETAVRDLAHTNATLANHEQRIVALEQDKLERIATRAESAHMWRAIADARDTDNEHPED